MLHNVWTDEFGTNFNVALWRPVTGPVTGFLKTLKPFKKARLVERNGRVFAPKSMTQEFHYDLNSLQKI